LIVRVHNLVPEKIWSRRYEQINEFEQLLAESGTEIIKCFLHISKETQRERLQARIDDPDDHWKFNPMDLAERKLWGDYHHAYEDAIAKCNTAVAPWYIIPSDRKWYRNLVVSHLLRSRLEAINPQYPPADSDFTGLVVE
jgi:polyphosphate kinase 2 (PPK2 family)